MGIHWFLVWNPFAGGEWGIIGFWFTVVQLDLGENETRELTGTCSSTATFLCGSAVAQW